MFGGRSQVSGSFSHLPLILVMPAKAGIHGRMDPGLRRDTITLGFDSLGQPRRAAPFNSAATARRGGPGP